MKPSERKIEMTKTCEIRKPHQCKQTRKRKEKRCTDLENIKPEDISFAYYDEDTKNLVFEPRVYQQRYQMVFDILINSRWREDIKTITEYGCGEYRLLHFFKHFLSLRKINFIDIDDVVLKENMGNLNICDYHYWNRRLNPLEVNVFEGSISDPDDRILNSDVVVGVEILEHLYPDTLEAIPYVIFHMVKPKIVIFTTPNADFNEALPNFQGVRHWDHKFEWTRHQFQSWAMNITLRFPEYKVILFGIGKGPEGTESLGCCSQLALFVRKDILNPLCGKSMSECSRGSNEQNFMESRPVLPFGICTYFTKSKRFENTEENEGKFFRKIHSQDYLYQTEDSQSDRKKLLDIMVKNMRKEAPKIDRVCSIPLQKIIKTYDFGVLISEEEAEDILTKYGFKVEQILVKDFLRPDNPELKLCVRYQVPRMV